jgi:hypothetical protein
MSIRSLNAHALLDLWDAGRGSGSVERALLALAAFVPRATREELAALSVGRRDELLFRAYAATFGPRLDGQVRCPRCGEYLELALLVSDLLVAGPPHEGDALFEANLELRVNCADCGAVWDAPFDPVPFLWERVEASARRLLGEIHALARAYGWREADVLALSSARRRAYLELVS